MRYFWITLIIWLLHGCGSSGAISDTLNLNSGEAGSRAKFTISKDYLYTINRSQMTLFNLSLASNPEYVSKISIPFNVETIFPYKEYLYMGASNGFYIYSIEDDPAIPNYVSQFLHIDSQDPIVVSDDIAYVTLSSYLLGPDSIESNLSHENILNIYDVRDPSNPKEIKQIPMLSPTGLSVKDNKLFICDSQSGLKMFEIDKNETDTTLSINITLITTKKDLDCFDIIIDENNTLIVSDKNGIYQFDYNDTTINEISKL